MAIQFEQVSHIYQKDSPLARAGLTSVSMTIPDKRYTAIIGQTGSGKSTLIQHLNALLKPTEGKVSIYDRQIDATTKDKQLKSLRKQVGVVFQFPEAQLFEESVLADVMFGPKNFGASQEQAQADAIEALRLVGIDDTLFERSPFDLSGGQMRRVAIAGVLAMKPDVLVLDEPTAGLDPKGALEMMQLFNKLHKQQQLTIVLVTHQMDDVALYAEHVIVMHEGRVAKAGTPLEVFADSQWLASQHIEQPSVMQFVTMLKDKGLSIPDDLLTIDQLATVLLEQLTGGGTRG